jgi:hypothetical protein
VLRTLLALLLGLAMSLLAQCANTSGLAAVALPITAAAGCCHSCCGGFF